MLVAQRVPELSASDVAKYYLYRASMDGDLITPLKMQKLVYLAYRKTLEKKNKRLFKEKIEAWRMGPVVPGLYKELNKFGSSPIPEEYIGEIGEEELVGKFDKETKGVVDEVYESYIGKSAFELVSLMHQDPAWKKARKGLSPEEDSSNEISDKDMLSEPFFAS